jgi:hypothetical protein
LTKNKYSALCGGQRVQKLVKPPERLAPLAVQTRYGNIREEAIIGQAKDASNAELPKLPPDDAQGHRKDETA